MGRRALLGPVAAAVFQQERLEGDLRSAHARLRAVASSAALSNGSGAEHAALQVRVSCKQDERLTCNYRHHGVTAALLYLGCSAALLYLGCPGPGCFRACRKRCMAESGAVSLQRRLAAAVANQRRLAAWHLVQAMLTQFLDYAGAIIAYCCIGLVIFRCESSRSVVTPACRARPAEHEVCPRALGHTAAPVFRLCDCSGVRASFGRQGG